MPVAVINGLPPAFGCSTAKRCRVIQLPQDLSVIAGLIPLFIYARQHPTNIILLGVWVGLHCMPPPQHILLLRVRERAKQSRGCSSLPCSLADEAIDVCTYRVCTRLNGDMVHASNFASAPSAMATTLAGLRLSEEDFEGASVLTHACIAADCVHERGPGHGVHSV